MRLLLVLSAALSFYQTPVLNPTPYRSANEAFVLDVDPSEPDGSGSGHCRLTRDGRVVWERQHPFTFFEAAVANDGTVAGVAYSLGLDGGGYRDGQGDLRLVVHHVLELNLPARREHRGDGRAS